MKRSFRDLFVWRASVDLAVRIIRIGDRLIVAHRDALADQLVRAACSVPSNIAEGQGRATTKDRRHSLVQARGSLYELDTQLEILARAELVAEEDDLHTAMDLVARIECGLTRMLAHLDTL